MLCGPELFLLGGRGIFASLESGGIGAHEVLQRAVVGGAEIRCSGVVGFVQPVGVVFDDGNGQVAEEGLGAATVQHGAEDGGGEIRFEGVEMGKVIAGGGPVLNVLAPELDGVDGAGAGAGAEEEYSGGNKGLWEAVGGVLGDGRVLVDFEGLSGGFAHERGYVGHYGIVISEILEGVYC